VGARHSRRHLTTFNNHLMFGMIKYRNSHTIDVHTHMALNPNRNRNPIHISQVNSHSRCDRCSFSSHQLMFSTEHDSRINTWLMQYTPTASIDTAVTSVDVDAGVTAEYAESKPPATPSTATLPMTPRIRWGIPLPLCLPRLTHNTGWNLYCITITNNTRSWQTSCVDVMGCFFG